MNGFTKRLELDDWQVIEQFLPPGWEEAARTSGAIRRARGIPNAAVLLRVLLVHLADGCSLQETALRVEQAGWCSISAVALFKRLRAAEEWLRWLAEQLWRQSEPAVPPSGLVVRVVDATTVQENGSTGTDWRVHYAINLSTLQCEHFELTDVCGGESFRRFPVKNGDVLLGDRAYGTSLGVVDVIQRGGHVVVRVNQKALIFSDKRGRKLTPLKCLRILSVGEVREWYASVTARGQVIPGRLVAIKLGRCAAQLARKRVQRKAQRKQRILSREALQLAGYVFVWTDLASSKLDAEEVLKLYRLRWQIELVFKRMKSILGLGQLPKTSDPSSRAWLHGKLLIAILVERLIETADRFSPWGYRLDTTPKSLA